MSADLLYSDVEQSLRESVRNLLAARLAPKDVMAVYDGHVDHSALWRALAGDLGLAALLVPEELGGAGASAREAAVVLEELGRRAAPVPFFTSAVIATVTVVAVGNRELAADLAAGMKTAALVVPLSATAANPTVELRDGTLHGRITSVADASTADVLVVPVRVGDGGMELWAAQSNVVSIAPVVSFDMTRPLADVTFDGAKGEMLASGDVAARAVAKAFQTGAGLLASEQLGLAQWCLDTTLAYVKERHQFGRAIGSYQAIKHRLADLWLEVSSASAAARYAADCLATDSDDTDVAVALAQAFCSDVAVHAAEEAIQLHGGIGMTWEHPAHLYLKRAKADQIALGTPDHHRSRLAELVDLLP